MKVRILILSLLLSFAGFGQIEIFHWNNNNAATVIGIYDTDAQAFFTAMEADASPVTLNNTQKNSVNQLVLDFKSASIWTKMKAVYPFIGGTASAHKWNLKDPRDLDAAYRLTFPNGATHSSGGVDWNGTTQYARTYMLANVLSSTSDHMSYYSRENTVGGNIDPVDIGAYVNAGGLTLNLRKSSGSAAGSSNLATMNFTNADSRGFYVTSRTSAISAVFYKNAVSMASTSTSTGTLPATEIYIGNCLVNGTIYNVGWSDRQCAFASMGDGLNSTESTAFYTAVQAYETSNSRQMSIPFFIIVGVMGSAISRKSKLINMSKNKKAA